MESDSDIEVIELVQNAIPDNTSNIPRIEPQGNREHEEIEERQENENERNVEEANGELGENEERDIEEEEEEEEELEDEEESEDNEGIMELDGTEGEKPEWASVGSVQELIGRYGNLSSMETELKKHISVVRAWLADYYLTDNKITKFKWVHWLNRYRMERLVQKMNKRERRRERRRISSN